MEQAAEAEKWYIHRKRTYDYRSATDINVEASDGNRPSDVYNTATFCACPIVLVIVHSRWRQAYCVFALCLFCNDFTWLSAVVYMCLCICVLYACLSVNVSVFLFVFLWRSDLFSIRWIRAHHVTTSSINPYRQNDFKSQYFNYYPYLTYIYIKHIVLTEIITFLNWYGVTAAQLTKFIHLYSCNNNFTLKMAAIAAETYWWEFSE